MRNQCIIAFILLLSITIILGGCSSSGTDAGQTAGYIQIPDGPKIRVVFNGPPELEVIWEKLGMMSDGFQVQLIGTMTNVSKKTVKFSEIGYFLDDYQTWYDDGRTMGPGDEMKLNKGFLYFKPLADKPAKIIEVRVKGFEVIGGSSANPEPTTTEPTAPKTTLNSTSTPTPPSNYLAEPLGNGFIMGDFSLGLAQISKKDNKLNLTFVTRRINSTGVSISSLSTIKVFDDHDNVYTTKWHTTLRSVGFGNEIRVTDVPVGFTWSDSYQIDMPEAAPVLKIELWHGTGSWTPLSDSPYQEKVWQFVNGKTGFSPLDIDSELKSGVISVGQTIYHEKYLRWSVGTPKLVNINWYGKSIQEWLIPFDVENLDYNPRKIQLIIGVQDKDGTVRDDISDLGGYFFSSPDDDPYRPAYAIQGGFINEEIPEQSRVLLQYFRIPVVSKETENMPDKLLILNKEEMGDKKLYILKLP